MTDGRSSIDGAPPFTRKREHEPLPETERRGHLADVARPAFNARRCRSPSGVRARFARHHSTFSTFSKLSSLPSSRRIVPEASPSNSRLSPFWV